MLAAIVAILCVTVIVALAMVLRFSARMVEKTGTTSCLRDVAILLRAFKAGPGGLLSALARAFRRAPG